MSFICRSPPPPYLDSSLPLVCPKPFLFIENQVKSSLKFLGQHLKFMENKIARNIELINKTKSFLNKDSLLMLLCFLLCFLLHSYPSECRSAAFIVNVGHFSHLHLMFLLLTLNM